MINTCRFISLFLLLLTCVFIHPSIHSSLLLFLWSSSKNAAFCIYVCMPRHKLASNCHKCPSIHYQSAASHPASLPPHRPNSTLASQSAKLLRQTALTALLVRSTCCMSTCCSAGSSMTCALLSKKADCLTNQQTQLRRPVAASGGRWLDGRVRLLAAHIHSFVRVCAVVAYLL